MGPEAAVTLLYSAKTVTSIAQKTQFIYSSYSGESPVITGFGVVTGLVLFLWMEMLRERVCFPALL